VINTNCETVYEKLVKPDYEIVDYNTRWSGITENDLKYCDVKIADVQRELLELFNRDTILVGHSLDSDFKALKVILAFLKLFKIKN
jgi:RNA exonuclease 1